MEKQVIPTCSPAMSLAKNTPGQLVNQLIEDAFAPGLKRYERSPEYVNGARALLLQQVIGKPLACLYLHGTAAADAFFAGVEEGRSIYARYLSVRQQVRSAHTLDGLKGHACIAACSLDKKVQRMQTSAPTSNGSVTK
ncbi:hypothetical protein [Duganella sp. CF458]|uniref:hypothetical protein n=1 Tax=Duganella sp. CF458 TaxID=1884368 RepID=UPI001113555C|nr:hypothetical protein [Duganella sp. CF458]